MKYLVGKELERQEPITKTDATIAPGRNPEGFTVAEVGEGYRLITDEEFSKLDNDCKPLQFCILSRWAADVDGEPGALQKAWSYRVPINAKLVTKFVLEDN